MSRRKSDAYDWIGANSPHAAAFKAGVERNGQASTRCPICDGKRLHRENAYGFCHVHHSWICWLTLRVACHSCRLRWGVIVKKCAEADALREPAGADQ